MSTSHNAQTKTGSDRVTAPDALKDIGLKIKALVEKRNKYEASTFESCKGNSKSGFEMVYFESGIDSCNFELDHLQDQIAFIKAKSVVGAALQVADLINRIWMLFNNMSSDEENFQTKKSHHLIERELYSVLDFLLETANCKMSDLAGDYFDGSHCNPWRSPAERIEACKHP